MNALPTSNVEANELLDQWEIPISLRSQSLPLVTLALHHPACRQHDSASVNILRDLGDTYFDGLAAHFIYSKKPSSAAIVNTFLQQSAKHIVAAEQHLHLVSKAQLPRDILAELTRPHSEHLRRKESLARQFHEQALGAISLNVPFALLTVLYAKHYGQTGLSSPVKLSCKTILQEWTQ